MIVVDRLQNYRMLYYRLPFALCGKPLRNHQVQRTQIRLQAMKSQRYLELSNKVLLITTTTSVHEIFTTLEFGEFREFFKITKLKWPRKLSDVTLKQDTSLLTKVK